MELQDALDALVRSYGSDDVIDALGVAVVLAACEAARPLTPREAALRAVACDIAHESGCEPLLADDDDVLEAA